MIYNPNDKLNAIPPDNSSFIPEPPYGKSIDYRTEKSETWYKCKICDAEYKTDCEAKDCEGEHIWRLSEEDTTDENEKGVLA